MAVNGVESDYILLTHVLIACFSCVYCCQPHASPTFHSLQYLLQNQTVEQLQGFRSYGGMQSYPSRTKDKVRCGLDALMKLHFHA